MSNGENLPAERPKQEMSTGAGFNTAGGFELLQRQAKVLSESALVPKEFQKNIPNCIIGLEIANRIGASPLAVLQNLYIVHGKPSWSSQFIIAAINSTNKFSPLRFDLGGDAKDRTCTAWATDLATGDRLESPRVSMEMAKSEGWIDKTGSKWKTMPELMLRYRAATFFGRLYAPEILMGMQTFEEVVDVNGEAPKQGKAASITDRVKAATAETVDRETGEVVDVKISETGYVCTKCQQPIVNGAGHASSCPDAEPTDADLFGGKG